MTDTPELPKVISVDTYAELSGRYYMLQAKYDIALNYIKRVKDFGNCHCLRLAPQLGEGYHHVTCRWRAEQILEELGDES